MLIIPKYDPLARETADAKYINSIRDQLEQSPIKIEGHVYDADEKADKRMREVLQTWDALGLTSVDWTLADNSVVTLTKKELQSVYEQIQVARADRGLRLHKKAREFKEQSPSPTMRDVQPENWL